MGPWRVEVSAEARRGLVRLPWVVRRRVAATLDGMERRGLPPDAEPEGADTGTYWVHAGNVQLLVLENGSRETLLLVRVDEDPRSTPRELLNALPLPGLFRSRLGALLDDVVLDVRFALRMLRRNPGFALMVVLTLSVGIGGSTALFGVVNTVFRGALPFLEGDRLVRLRDEAVTAEGHVRAYNMSPRDFDVIRAENRVFEDVVAQRGLGFVLTGERAERVAAVGVTRGWARTLGLTPVLGRVFTPDEEAQGVVSGVALLSYGLWQGRFGGDPDLVGREVTYDGGRLTVVGVMGGGFSYPYDAELWVPWLADPFDWRGHDLNVVARMRDGASLEGVREDMARLYAALEESSPETTPDSGIEVRSVRTDFVRDEARVVQALFAAVVFLLLLACVNVANLLTIRLMARRGEIGVRAALGAGRGRQLRHQLVETLLLFVAGGLGALALTALMGGFLTVLIPDVMRRQLSMDGIRLDGAVVGFALAVSVAAGLLFGLMAALRGARPDLQSLLKGIRGSPRRGERRFQDGLVVTQIALSLGLLVGAGVMVDHFRRLQFQSLGYDLNNLHTLRITLEQERYTSGDARVRLVQALQERVRTRPGVGAVGATTVNPLCCGDWGAPIQIEGREPAPNGAPILVHHRNVTPGYFEAMGIPILRGRNLEAADRLSSPPVVVVDEAFARRFWPGQDAVGKRVRLDRPGSGWRTVVGVVPTVYREGDYEEAWYVPYYQAPEGRSSENVHLMVRGRGGTVDEARRAIAEIDAALAVHGVATMRSLRQRGLAQDRLGAVVTALFAAFALALAAFGLFGLLNYIVTLRSGEIATRVALGATRPGVAWLVVAHAALRLALGALVGLTLAFALNRVLASMVDGITWIRPLPLGLLVSSLALAALGAAVAPALRAARIDPAMVLRD